MLMSKSRLEKFLYALYSLDSSDLPTPLSRIEELYKCLVTGEEPPTFEPLSRVEKYLMAILGVYDVDSLPNPLSRVEVLLYKLAMGDDNLDDVKSFLSEHEELLAEIIRNGSYVLYTLSTEHGTLYNTAKKPVKSAILKGNTGYRDIDTGEFLETFEEGRNLELVSVKMPVLTTTTKNLFNIKSPYQTTSNGMITNNAITVDGGNGNNFNYIAKYKIPLAIGDIGKQYTISSTKMGNGQVEIRQYDENDKQLTVGVMDKYATITILENACYIMLTFSARLSSGLTTWTNIQVEESPNATSYEPHKSNILSTPSDLELRGIGDVRDELDLLTGEVVENVGEVDIVSKSLSLNGTPSTFTIVRFYDKEIATSTSWMCNKCNIKRYYTECISDDNEGIFAALDGNIYIKILSSKLTSQTVDGIKELGLKIQYKLLEKVVKTVDLSVVDQDGNDTELSTFNDITHVTLSSEGLIPKAELEVAMKAEVEEELL